MITASTAYAVLLVAAGCAMVVEASRRRSTRSLLGQRGCGAFIAASGAALYAAITFESRHALNDGAAMTIATIAFLGLGSFYRRLSSRVGGPDQSGWPLEARLAGPLLLLIAPAAVLGNVWRGMAVAASILAFVEHVQWFHWQVADRSGRRP
jgi:hypothetical protein